MAVDERTNFFTENQSKENTFSSIKSARVQRRQDMDSFRKGNEEAQYLNALDEQIKKLDAIADRTKTQNKLLADAQALQKQMNDFTDINNQNYEEFLKKNEEVLKITQRINKEVYNVSYDKNLDNEKEISRLIRQRSRDQEHYNDLIDSLNEKLNTNKEANKSAVDALTANMDKLRGEIKDLAVIKGVGDITSGLFGSGNTSMLSAYNNTRSQLGVTASEFNQFKGNLFKQLKDTGNLFEFGWKDTADYMARLGELNITSQEMAEEQYLAVIQGTKYLGLQTETQAKILKISRDTGRSDLLQQTNETMVQIMNAQLGVSKDQLNTMVNQAASLTDMSVFLGGNGDAMQQLTKIQAAVTKEYGKSTSDAAMNILTEIMNNPAGNKYLTSGFLGGNYNQIVQLAQNGQMDEAIKLIINSVKGSNATSVAQGNIYAANALGADNNIMAIANSSGDMDNVTKNMADINNSSSDIAETIKDFNKSWSDKLINFGSNFLSLLPFNEFITLQNAYYAVAMVEMLIKLPAQMKSIIVLLSQIAKSSAIGATGLDLSNPGGIAKILSSNLSPLVAIAAGVASLAMFANDAATGNSKSDEWGTTKVAATVGGAIGGTDSNGLARTLKNAGKYALAGAALGSFFPGIGNVAGWVIGGLIGLVAGGITGGIGGENIAKGLDNIFGTRKDLDTNEGAVGAAPTFTPPQSSTGGKGAASDGGYPWTITSPFGHRTLSNGDSSFHNGVDWGIRTGTPIGAPVSGKITSAQVDNRNTYPSGPKGAGSGIYLLGDDGVTYQFWHLSSVGVQKGQRVLAGQAIGLSGNTGYSTGAHLHYGTKVNGTWVNPLNGHVTSGLFNANGDKYIDPEMAANNTSTKEGEKLLQTVISSDTVSSGSGGVGAVGNEDVVFAINNGFSNLNAKLEELSSRQDNQEEVLRQLTSGRRTSLERF